MDGYEKYTFLFESTKQWFHCKRFSNNLYIFLKLMSFKIKDTGSKIQDHIDELFSHWTSEYLNEEKWWEKHSLFLEFTI